MKTTLSFHRLDIATGVITAEQMTIEYGMQSAMAILLDTLNAYNKTFNGKYQYWV